MGVAASLSLDQVSPEASELLKALKKGEHLKALRLSRQSPLCTLTIPAQQKARILHSAVKRGNVNILQLLSHLPGENLGLELDASVNPPPPLERSRSPSALSPPSEARPGETTEDAVQGGGRNNGRESWLNAIDRRGRMPLVTAVLHNRLELVEGLVSLGADPWAGGRRTRTTAVHLAAWLGHAPLVAALLRTSVPGPDRNVALYNVKDMYGFTPLHYAAAGGHADVADVLLAAGASYVAASQLPYDPSRNRSHLPALQRPWGRVAASSLRRRLAGLTGGAAGGGGGGGGSSFAGERLPACAPRSNPLHLAALRGDGAVVSVILHRYLADTEGLSRAARERVTDPRRQLNKDGFQPYMLAGNMGHWHVAQMLIPHSRDDQLIRNRDFLIFFPLPDAAAAGGGGADGGPPSLAELAARAWAAKLLADVKVAEAAVRQQQSLQPQQATPAAAAALLPSDSSRSGGGSGGGGGGGVLGALLRRSSKLAKAPPAPAAAAAATGATDAPTPATGAINGVSVPTAGSFGGGGGGGDGVGAGGDVGCGGGGFGAISPARTPRSSASGSRPGSVTGRSLPPPAVAAFAVGPSAREARRSVSLDLPLPPPPGPAAAAAAPSSPSSASPLKSSQTPALCDVCFEHPQQLALRPCPHRLCASCCRRVVEMHCSGAAAAVAAAAAGQWKASS